MAPPPRLGISPQQALLRAILKVTTGLRKDITATDGVIDLLDLKVGRVCRNAIAMLRASNPYLEQLLVILGPLAVLGFGVYKYIYAGLQLHSMLSRVYEHYNASITLPATAPLNAQVLKYIAKHGADTSTRSFTVLNDPVSRAEAIISGDKPIVYIPELATDCWFRHNNRWLKFSRTLHHVETINGEGVKVRTAQDSSSADVTISAFAFFGSVDVVKGFLEQVNVDNKPEAKTSISRIRKAKKADPYGAYPWTVATSKTARGLSSVTMEAAKKDSLVDDIEKYLGSREWYQGRGIPWRRGYLLYGPPGTGKTSISTAIAGHFSLPLYIISFSDSITDTVLQSAFDALPSKCVLLMEDIDSAGIMRDRMAAPKKDSKGSSDLSKSGTNPPKGITLSGLLNAIDGPMSKEGRILIMTSNSPDSLDPALVRPGRIDQKILFGNANHEVAATLFMHIFGDSGGEAEHSLEALSQAFAGKIPKDKLTPAEIQGFLLMNRGDPQKAVQLAETFAIDLIANKVRGNNVANFSGQIAAAGTEDANATRDTDSEASARQVESDDEEVEAEPAQRFPYRGSSDYFDHRYLTKMMGYKLTTAGYGGEFPRVMIED